MAKKRTFNCKTDAGNPKRTWVANQNAGFTSSFSHIINYHRAFWHDITVAILVFQNNETETMLAFKTSPVAVGFFLRKQFLLFPYICIDAGHMSEMADYMYVTGRDEVNLQSILISSWRGEMYGSIPTALFHKKASICWQFGQWHNGWMFLFK